MCDIPKGGFIANYVGALMTDEIAEIKGKNDDQYFADLDLNDVVCFMFSLASFLSGRTGKADGAK